MRPRVRFGAHFAAKPQRKAARRSRKSEKQRCPAGEMRHPSLVNPFSAGQLPEWLLAFLAIGEGANRSTRGRVPSSTSAQAKQ